VISLLTAGQDLTESRILRLEINCHCDNIISSPFLLAFISYGQFYFFANTLALRNAKVFAKK